VGVRLPSALCLPIRIHPRNPRPQLLTIMDPTRELGKVLLIGGLVLVAAGAFLLLGARLPFRLGRLPGDIAIEGRRGAFYFPIVTSLLLSVALTLIFWFVGWLRK
jgi:hypothetical protein